MDRPPLSLFRIACLLVGLCCLLVGSGSAVAYGTVPQATVITYRVNFLNGQFISGYSANIADACEAMRAFLVAQQPANGPFAVISCTTNGSVVRRTNPVPNPPTDYTGVIQTASNTACPSDSTLASGSCICNSGFKATGSSCSAINCQAARDEASNQYWTWSGNTSSTCIKGCTMSCALRGYLSASNKSSCEGTALLADSSSCQGANAGANTDGNGTGTAPSAQVCPASQCPGTVNGLSVCVACSNTVAPGPSVTASAPSGGTSPTLAGAPPGSVSSTKETECIGAQCTTTTTYRDSQGAKTGETQEKDSLEGFCKQNPASPLCVQSKFAGACAGGFTCSGDAIQCAIARDQHSRNCQAFDDQTPLTQAGLAAANGEAQPSGHPGANGGSVSMSFASAIDTSDRLAGGCPSNVNFVVGGSALVLPLSDLCGPLSMLGTLMVGLSMFAAAFIVFRS